MNITSHGRKKHRLTSIPERVRESTDQAFHRRHTFNNHWPSRRPAAAWPRLRHARNTSHRHLDGRTMRTVQNFGGVRRRGWRMSVAMAHMKIHLQRVRDRLLAGGLVVLLMHLGPAAPVQADTAQDFYNQALTQLQRENFKDAAEALEEALKVFPRFAAAHHLLGSVLFHGLRQPQQAIAHLKHAVALHPNFAQAYLDLGKIYQRQHKLEDAAAAFQKAADIYPQSPEAQLHLAVAYDQADAWEPAIRAYETTLDLEAGQPTALYNLAALHNRRGNTDLAKQRLQTLIRLAPGHAAAWLLLAQLAEQDGRTSEAIQAYRNVLDADPDSVDAHYALGYLLQTRNQAPQAAAHFREVIRLNPKHAEAHLNLGVILTNLDKFEQAEREYLNARDLNPTLADVYYNLGVLYEFHRKDTARACSQYRRYEELGGRDERVRTLLQKGLCTP